MYQARLLSRQLCCLVLNRDCGGQDAFYESYFDSQRDLIFRSVEVCTSTVMCPANAHCCTLANILMRLSFSFQVLIYVFDIESGDVDKDMNHFMGVLEVSYMCQTDTANVDLSHHKALCH